MRVSRFALLLIFISSFFAFPVSAQSPGCAAINGFNSVGVANGSFGGVVFEAGEVVTLDVTVAGTDFTLQQGGADVAGPSPIGTPLSFTVTADGAFDFGWNVTGGGAGTVVSFSCSAGGDTDTEEDGDVTLCHIPPGNPGAAHTITVGAADVDAYLANGDSLGACDPTIESRFNSPGGVVIFTNELIGQIEIYGACANGNCAQLLVINLNILVPQVGFEMMVEADDDDGDDDDGDDGDDDGDDDDNGDDDDGDDDDDDNGNGVASNTYVIIFYLGTSHIDVNVNVFQINVYTNNNLVDDNVLVLLGPGGSIDWTTQDDYNAQ